MPRHRVAPAVLAVALAAAGCGSDEPPEPVVVVDEAHHAAVAKDPYRLTCGDLERQPLNSTNQRLVIHAEFDLAQAPALRARVRDITANRVGRSIYWAITEICRNRDGSYEPGRDAVDAVRRGEYLVQPRPQSWSRPELWSETPEN